MDTIGGRYQLGRTLGAGGMARVVEAYDPVLDRHVAIKLLRDDIAVDPSVRERFLREAKTAARFNHPNAVAVFDTGEEGRQPWIVMELVDGEDLAARLARGGALNEEEAVRVADGVLAALAAAHAGGMVHRDVKPGNIMLLEDGRVKLADFGIAKSVQDVTAGLTMTGQIIGTAKYLSPEQVEGHPATPASDVYATGAVLYEMLAGGPPFDGETAVAIAMAHMNKPVPDLRRQAEHVSADTAAVVTRALAKDPAQRYRDAGEMRAALEGGAPAGATAVIDRSETTQVLTRERPGRSPLPIVLLVLAAALLAVALLSTLGDGEETAQEQPQEQSQEQSSAPAETAPATQPPAEEPSQPVEEAPLPTDLPGLVTFLEENPDEFGKAQNDLLKRLEEIQSLEGDEQAVKALETQVKIAEWVPAGELEPDIAQLALRVLQPFAAAAPAPEDDDEEGDGGPGNGKGQGRGKEKDD